MIWFSQKRLIVFLGPTREITISLRIEQTDESAEAELGWEVVNEICSSSSKASGLHQGEIPVQTSCSLPQDECQEAPSPWIRTEETRGSQHVTVLEKSPLGFGRREQSTNPVSVRPARAQHSCVSCSLGRGRPGGSRPRQCLASARKRPLESGRLVTGSYCYLGLQAARLGCWSSVRWGLR